MKIKLLSLIGGIVALIVMMALADFVLKSNMRYTTLLPSIMAFIVGIITGRQNSNHWIQSIFIAIPLMVGMHLFITQVISLTWFFLPFIYLSGVGGLYVGRHKHSWHLGVLPIALTIPLSFVVLPNALISISSDHLNEESPQFEIENLHEGPSFTKESFKDQVVVLDFFGTWCVPCIKEMKALENVQKELLDKNDQLKFLIVNTDQGGDTPEKTLNFYQKRNLNFLLGYDHEATVFNSMSLKAVPALVVLDKKGNIRFKHIGYNEVERLNDHLKTKLLQLLNE